MAQFPQQNQFYILMGETKSLKPSARRFDMEAKPLADCGSENVYAKNYWSIPIFNSWREIT